LKNNLPETSGPRRSSSQGSRVSEPRTPSSGQRRPINEHQDGSAAMAKPVINSLAGSTNSLAGSMNSLAGSINSLAGSTNSLAGSTNSSEGSTNSLAGSIILLAGNTN